MHVEPQNVAGVILETYQGGSAAFAPPAYMQALRQWCTGHKALLVCDEVQAGFGRTGTLWGFEHYGIVPDLATFGKGISSSLPLAAVAGRPDVMDLHPAGQHDLHPHRQSGLLRRRAGVHRSGGEREPRGAMRAAWATSCMRSCARMQVALSADRLRGRQGPGGGRRLRRARHEGARRRSGLGRGRALHGEGRADVHARSASAAAQSRSRRRW